MKNKNIKKLSFMPLGGVDHINRNCYVVEYGPDILVVDLGISFPDDAGYGIDYFIPDVDYLRKRKNQIAGIVLTHAHLDHIGAIPYVIEELGFPTIYGRQFTIMFLKEKLREYDLHKKVDLKVIEPKQDVKIKSMTVRWIPVTHAIPQSCSVLVKTPGGNVMYTGDYKFDDQPVNEPVTDYAELKRIGNEGVDLLCMDSTNVFEEGKALSETEISKNLEKIIKRSRGRVIVATFSSLGTRLYSLIKIAQKLGKKIVVSGRSMKSMLSILRKINYIDVPDSLFIDERTINKHQDNKLLVLATGTQGEEHSALDRISRKEHRTIKVKKGDTIILSSSVIPGNDVAVQHLIDDLLRLGARLFHKAFMDVHTSGHGYQEDMKKMYELVRPKNVVPVHGYPSFREEMNYLLGKWGMDKSRIIMASTGQQFTYSSKSKKWYKENEYKTKEIYVDGGKVGELNQEMIKERARLAQYGALFVSIKVGNTNHLVGKPRVVCMGFDNRRLRDKVESYLSEKYESYRGKAHRLSGPEIPKLQGKLTKLVSNIVRREIGKEPVVVVSIV